METVRDIRPIVLARRGVHRIEDGRGLQVTCFKGHVWITQQRDPRDIVLGAGQSFVLDRRGSAIVFALKDAVIHVGAAGQIAAAQAQAA